MSGSTTAAGRTRWPAVVRRTPDINPVLKYDRHTGELLAEFGAGLFVLPHGLHVDDDGNVWVTDSQGNEAGTKGHQVIKFTPKARS